MPVSSFTKMHGCGNSFLVAMASATQASELQAAIPALCASSFGIGSDGMMLIEPRHAGDFEVFMYNPDGSLMGMCGNGIRCVARFVYDKGLVKDPMEWIQFVVEGRQIECRIHQAGKQIEVNMGAPQFRPEQIPMLREEMGVDLSLKTARGEFSFTAVSMGNPHCVIFTNDVEAVDLSQIGPLIEHHPDFPRRINVEFVTAISRDHLKVRVWERGAGITLACGTGACASLVAGVLTDRCDTNATVELPGGSVSVRWDRDRDLIFMTGPASHVGEIAISPEFFDETLKSRSCIGVAQ